MTPDQTPPVPILVDSHVHLYSCFDPETFLDSALRNFQSAAQSLGSNGEWLGYLLFTEVQGLPTFDQLIRDRREASGSKWNLESTAEAYSLRGLLHDEVRLILVRGRQVVTKESIEVLALACAEDIPDGRSAEETLELSAEKAGISVLPWGFGKWLQRRGALVERLLLESAPGSFFLGDTSSRANFLPEPRHFKLARERGFRVLPGTDPLPFAHEVGKPGSCGFLLQAEVDPERPADSFLAAIDTRSTEIASYTRADSLLPFVRNQLAMQIRKRLR